MKIIVLIVIALVQAASYNLTYEQFLNSTPSQFGVLTVTHARNGNYSYFEKHLDKYASMQCPQMMEIAVAWNNDITPEEAGFSKKLSWKRPVHFIKTPYNSMDFRYLLSQESKAQVYFSMDDDVATNCKQLRKSFLEWKKHAVGDIAPILSYQPRSFNFEAQNSTYKYIMGKKFPTYFLTLTGVAWIPRTYLELYYSSLGLVQELRDQVRQKNNCDDILMNYLVNYYFPQFLSRTFNYSLKMFNLPGSQSTTNIHKKIRQGCLQKFSQILGFNPLRGVSLHHTDRADLYLSEVNKYSLYMRRYEIGQLIKWELESGLKQNFILGKQKNSTGEVIKRFQFQNPWVVYAKQLQQKDRLIQQKQQIIKQINSQIQQKNNQIADIYKKNPHLNQKTQQTQNSIEEKVQNSQQVESLIELKDESIQKNMQDDKQEMNEKKQIEERDRKIEEQNKQLEISQNKLSQHIKYVTYALIVLLVVIVLVGVFPLKLCACFRKTKQKFEQIQTVNIESIE